MDASGKQKTPEKSHEDLQPSVFRKRWFILLIFSFVSMANNFQWLHLNIIGDAVLKNYNSSLPEDTFQKETALDWLSMVTGHITFYMIMGLSEKQKNQDTVNEDIQPQVFRKRWFILFIFSCVSLTNNFQWLHLNIIGDVLLKYYNASMPEDKFQKETALDWLSMVYMLAYIPLIFPLTWLLDKRGLRVVIISGSFLNAIGAWIKVACVNEGRFALLMFAQIICAIAQIFILGIPARLAAVWFGPDQVSTATSLGVLGNQLGAAVGFLLPPVLVPYNEDLVSIGKHLDIMFYIGGAVTTFLFLVVIVAFDKEPPEPPSKAQCQAVANAANQHYDESLLRLFKNRGFLLLVLSYGVNIGSFYATSTLLNPVILHYFPGHQKETGEIGLTIVTAGVLGSIIAGIWLDKTKTFKGTTVGIYFLSVAGMVVFTFTLKLSLLWLVFLCAAVLGFFMTGYLPVGFEFAAEITYPESEGTSSGLLNASAQNCNNSITMLILLCAFQLFGIILTIVARALMNKVSILVANITLSSFLLFGLIITGFIDANYNRQSVEQKHLSQIGCMELGVDVVKNENTKLADKKGLYS